MKLNDIVLVTNWYFDCKEENASVSLIQISQYFDGEIPFQKLDGIFFLNEGDQKYKEEKDNNSMHKT